MFKYWSFWWCSQYCLLCSNLLPVTCCKKRYNSWGKISISVFVSIESSVKGETSTVLLCVLINTYYGACAAPVITVPFTLFEIDI